MKDLYKDVTERIVAEMEEGRLPWVQAWDAGNVPTRPENASTGARYNGVNILLLWGRLFQSGYPVNAWMTYRQARKMGAQVRRGESGTQIVKVVTFEPKAERERAAEAGETPKSRAALRAYSVFNVAQIDGLSDDLYSPAAIIPEPERHARAEALIAASGARCQFGGNRACYWPHHDRIDMPPINSFCAESEYYSTFLHELTHWTGHRSRLDAPFGMKGTHDYFREELRAELGAAFLCATLGIEPTNRHSDYLAGYIDALKSDARLLFSIASAASKAAEYVLAFETDAAAIDAAA